MNWFYHVAWLDVIVIICYFVRWAIVGGDGDES